jgi:hypothetical protein
MASYTLSAEGIRHLRSRLIAVFMGSAVVGTAIAVWVMSAMLLHLEMLDEYWCFIPVIPAGMLVLIVPMKVALERMMRSWRAFSIDVEGDYVASHPVAGQELRIRREDVAGVRETRRALVISASGNEAAIGVPVELGYDAYQEIRAVVSRWARIETEPDEIRRARITVVIFEFVALVVVILSLSRWLTIAAFLVQTAGYLWLVLSRQVARSATRLFTKYLVLSALVTAVKLSPLGEHCESLLRALFFMH